MYCKFCGAENADNSKFCAYCGTNIEMVKTNSTPQPAKVINNPTIVLDNTPPYTPINQAIPTPTPVMQPVYPVQNTLNTQSINPAPAQQNFSQTPDIFAQATPNAMLDENVFFETYASKSTKSNYKATMIISFITAVVSLVSLFIGNVFAIVDITVYLVLGILLLKKKKWVLPLGVAIYGGVGTAISMGVSGTPSGIAALVIAILATMSAKKVDEAYKNYKTTGALPTKPIGK